MAECGCVWVCGWVRLCVGVWVWLCVAVCGCGVERGVPSLAASVDWEQGHEATSRC